LYKATTVIAVFAALLIATTGFVGYSTVASTAFDYLTGQTTYHSTTILCFAFGLNFSGALFLVWRSINPSMKTPIARVACPILGFVAGFVLALLATLTPEAVRESAMANFVLMVGIILPGATLAMSMTQAMLSPKGVLA
jgi:uncharacterized membrane protein YciS (DUF1049 family)